MENKKEKNIFKDNIMQNGAQSMNTINENNNPKNEEKKQQQESENKINSENQNIKFKGEIQEALKEKSQKIIQFSEILDNIILNNEAIWINCRKDYENFFEANTKQQINTYLCQSCNVLIQENVLLTFKFLCKYFSSRMNYLKEISSNEIIFLVSTPYKNFFNANPISDNPEGVTMIDDRYFYQIFKELLPDKEVENSYINIRGNCMLKYFYEYLLQSGFIDTYIDNVLTRDDFTPNNYMNLFYFVTSILLCCDRDFLLKHDYNIKLIKNNNEKFNFFLSVLSTDFQKNYNNYYQFINIVLCLYNDRIFAVFNRILPELRQNYPQDCEEICISFLKYCDFLLKQQKLEYKILGLNMLNNLCGLYRFLDMKSMKKSYNDVEEIYEYVKQNIINFLNKINIFDLIFGENIHEALVARCYNILSFLYKNNSFSAKQISLLWEISQKKYQSISNTIITLFGQLLPEFSNEDCNYILNIVLMMDLNDVNEITLKLLENFFNGNERREILLQILMKFSSELSFNKGLPKNIIIKSRDILINLILNNINYSNDLNDYIKGCISNLKNFYQINTYDSILIKILKEINKNKNNPFTKDILTKMNPNINDFTSLILFLDERYYLYPVYMNLLIKIIRLFKFFNNKLLQIKQIINEGNFDFEDFIKSDYLLNEYGNYISNHIILKFPKKKKNNEIELDENSMDLETNKNIEELVDTENEENIRNILSYDNQDVLKNSDYQLYIKSLMNDFATFCKNEMFKNNFLPSDEEIKRITFTKIPITFEKLTYTDLIRNITREFCNGHNQANIKCKIQYLNYLYYICVKHGNIDIDKNSYYNMLSDFFCFQINSNEIKYMLTDQDMDYLIKEKIAKCDYKDYKFLPFSAFTAVNVFHNYYNDKYKLATYSPYLHKFTDIKNFEKFYGFEIIWNFYLYTQNNFIYERALDVLMNILEITSKNPNNRKKIMDKIFAYMKNNSKNIQNNEDIKTSFIRCLKLISVVNGCKVSKEDGGEIITLYVKNYFFKNNINMNELPKIQISKLKKFEELKEYIITNVICVEKNLEIYNNILKQELNNNKNINGFNIIIDDENNNNFKPITNIEDFKKDVYKKNIIINYKNKVMEQGQTLADLNIKNGDSITVINSMGYQPQKQFEISDEQLKEGYSQMRLVFGDKFNEEIMKTAIIKNEGDFEKAILYLCEPSNVENIKKEIEENKKNIEENEDDILCLDEEIINLLLDVLDGINDQVISNNIWQLFSEIKYPDDIIEKTIKDNVEVLLGDIKLNKVIFNLKLVNSLVFDDVFCKYNKITKEQKSNWISKFINNPKLSIEILSVLTSDKYNDVNIFNQLSQMLYIFSFWFHEIIFKISENIKDNLPLSSVIKDIQNYQKNKLLIANKGVTNSEELEKNKLKELKKFDINNQEGENFMQNLDNISGISYFYDLIDVVMKYIKDKQNILENIYEFLLIYLLMRPNNFNIFEKKEKEKKILLKILSNEFSNDYIKLTKFFIQSLIKNSLTIDNNLSQILYKELHENIIGNAIYNENFYEIYAILIPLIAQNKTTDQIILPPIEKLFEDIYNLCINLNPTCDGPIRKKIAFESFILYNCHPLYDDIIKNTVAQMLSKGKNIINILYSCLFDVWHSKNCINSIKFNENISRQHAFNLLNVIISLDINFLKILLPKILLKHQNLEPTKHDTPLDVKIRDPIHEKLIGCRNFGATCYLNSLFQQMFMNPIFKKDIFNFEIKSTNENDFLKSSVIYNMQFTFASLLMGCMSPYPPFKFMKSFKNAFNGEPIQFGIQQDSDEFLSILGDNLEKEAKIYDKENFLENSFKGKIANEIVSLEQEYPYYSQSDEPFYRITLDIKGHKTLEEALDAYVKGEVLDGDNKYYVEKYKKKISIRKNSSLKKLGNTVIVHLKRFEFDFVTFTNNKLNDYLKFPLELNLKKWTRAYLRTMDKNLKKDLLNITKEEEENLNDEKMNYILTGILIHGGSNLQSGHYYSYIMDQETGKWHQFNDSVISDYDINKNLEKDCFGNLPEQNCKYGRGAYLLFYTKKNIFRNSLILNNIVIKDNIINDVYQENIIFINYHIYHDENYQKFIQKFVEISMNVLEDDEKNTTSESHFYKHENKILQKVFMVLKDNIDFDEKDDENLVLPENIEQIYNKCKEEIDFNYTNEKNNNNKIKNIYTKKDIIKLSFYYTFGCNLHNHNNSALFYLAIQAFNQILENNRVYSLWILKQIEKNNPLFMEIIFKFGLITAENQKICKEIYSMIKLVCETVYQYEKYLSNIMNNKIKILIKDDKGKFSIKNEEQSCFLRIVQIFCQYLEKSRVDYIKNDLYLELLYFLVKTFNDSSKIFSHFLLQIISLVTNNSIFELKNIYNPNFYMGNDQNFIPNPKYIMIFSEIILRCVTPGMLNSNKFSPYFIGKINDENSDETRPDFSIYPKLPEGWEKMLISDFCINYIFFHNNCRGKEIICHLCYCDEKTSVKILSLVNEYLKHKEYSYIQSYQFIFNVIINVFEIKDSLEFIRCDTLFQLNINAIDIDESKNKDSNNLTLLEFCYEERYKSFLVVVNLLFLIANIIERSSLVSDYFMQHKEKFMWVLDFYSKIKKEDNFKTILVNSDPFKQNPSMMNVIYNNLIKKFGFEK